MIQDPSVIALIIFDSTHEGTKSRMRLKRLLELYHIWLLNHIQSHTNDKFSRFPFTHSLLHLSGFAMSIIMLFLAILANSVLLVLVSWLVNSFFSNSKEGSHWIQNSETKTQKRFKSWNPPENYSLIHWSIMHCTIGCF